MGTMHRVVSSNAGAITNWFRDLACLTIGLLLYVASIEVIAAPIDEALNNRPGWLWNGSPSTLSAKWLSGENLSINIWNQAYSQTLWDDCDTATVVYSGITYQSLNSQSMHCVPYGSGKPIAIFTPANGELFGNSVIHMDGCYALSGTLSVYDYGTRNTYSFSHRCVIDHINVQVNLAAFTTPGDVYAPRNEDTSSYASLGLKTIRNSDQYADGSTLYDNHGDTIGIIDKSFGADFGYVGSTTVGDALFPIPLSQDYWRGPGSNLDILNITHASFPENTEGYEIEVKRYSKDSIVESINEGFIAFLSAGQGNLLSHWGGTDTVSVSDVTPHRDVLFAQGRQFNSQYVITIRYYRFESGSPVELGSTTLMSNGKRGAAWGELSDSAMNMTAFLAPFGTEPVIRDY